MGTVAAAVSAVAAIFAIYVSYKSAFESQLSSRQADAVVKFIADANDARNQSRSLQEQIASAQTQPAERSNLRNVAADKELDIKNTTTAFSLVFPLEEFDPLSFNLADLFITNEEFVDSLNDDPTNPHLRLGESAETAAVYSRRYNKIALCVPRQLSILIECARERLRAGHPLTQSDAHDCAKSMYSKNADSSRASDVEECYSRQKR